MKPWERFAQPEQGPWTKFAQEEQAPESAGDLSNLVLGKLPEPSTGQKIGAVARAAWEGITGPARLGEQIIGKLGIPGLSEAAAADAEERGQALKDAKRIAPVGATVAEIGGSILSPTSVATMGAFPLSGAPSVVKSALQGAGQGGLFALMQPVQDTGNMLSEKLTQLLWGAGGGAAGGAVAGKAQSVISNRAAQKAANTTKDAAGVAARNVGYTIPPVTTNPSFMNRVTEGFAGKLTTAQQASMQNQNVTNALVRKALGMADDAPITKEALAALRKNAGAAYEAVKGVPQPFVADDVFNAAVDKMRANAGMMLDEFPSLVNKDVTPILDDLARGQWSPKVAVEVTKRLREKASTTLRSPAATSEAKEIAYLQKDAAKALEDLIARNLEKSGLKDLHGAWQAARTEIAKVKNVEKALNDSTGNVIAKKLGEQMERGSPLTGELRTVAKASKAFPKATAQVTESMPGISPLDYAVGGGIGTISGNPLALALPLTRPAMRSLILSPAYQRMMGTPGYGSPIAGLLSRSHPAIPAAAGSLLLAD